MKQIKNLARVFVITLVTSALQVGCTEKDLFDPDYGKPNLPSLETLPDFATQTEVNLNVDYETQGFQTFIEIYTEYPYDIQPDGRVVKRNILPPFAAYTDNNGRFSGRIALPASVTTVFLCTPSMGLPRCLGLTVTEQGINFKRSELSVQTKTYVTVDSPTSGSMPYLLWADKQLYSLCQWGTYGKPDDGYIENVRSNISDFTRSIQYTLWGGSDIKPEKLHNEKYAVGEEHINVTIANKVNKPDGSVATVESAVVKLIFLDEAAWNQNSLGYYYYKSDAKPTDMNQVKKYVIFPNTSTSGSVPFDGNDGYHQSWEAPLMAGSEVMLRFVDEQGNISNDFPAGYTIGWFIMPNAYKDFQSLNVDMPYIYSNQSWNESQTKRCIALNHTETGRVIMGFEDGTDTGFEDILFFVESTPKEAISDPDKPSIDVDGEVDIPDKVEMKVGTLTFEDNWPQTGDYDLNDVVVEYHREVTFDKENKVKKIVDRFKAVQGDKSATFNSAFAYQVDALQIGTYVLPKGAIYEHETNSFVLFPNSNEAKGKEFVVIREFTDGNMFDKQNLSPYNPFIIVKYEVGKKDRLEVHLPKNSPTSYADTKLIGTHNDAYYIYRNGKYPFALEVPILNFTLVTEQKKIGSEGEYPLFGKWVESDCKEFTDWYLQKN